ncbi:MAG: LacI family DNA-binding transcriptional regulator [Luteolibacter sp.]
MKMIGLEAGVHISTVSLALNGHPSIPEKTQDRIRQIAEEMGYRPDPALSSLVAYRSSKREKADQGVLAWLDFWPDETCPSERFPGLWTGAADRAHAFGWKLEGVRPAASGMSLKKTSKMLRDRGIVGLLIGPLPSADMVLEIEWPWYAAVCLGHSLDSPALHSAQPHQMQNMQLLLRELAGLGYKRPGLVIDTAIHANTKHYWMAAFLDAQLSLDANDRPPPLLVELGDLGKIGQWHGQHHPDVIISSLPAQTIALLRDSGLSVPHDVGVAAPSFANEIWRPELAAKGILPDTQESGISGIDERFPEIGIAGLDKVVALINRHERGAPPVPRHLMIGGIWRCGKTVMKQPE